MAAAEQIMKGKAFIRREMERQLPKQQSDALWEKAEKRLAVILDQYAGIPKGEHMHTDRYIFPAAAIYLTAKEALGQEQAYSIIENAAVVSTRAMGERLAKMMRIPGFCRLFLWLWDPISREMFGPDRGFRNVFYPREKDGYRMDITSCPYDRYFSELGCPELTRIFCDNDERTYGNLPGLKFSRSTTLGKGGKRCDFYLKKTK